jgi:hypothetical protein
MLVLPERVLAEVQIDIQPLVSHRDHAGYSPAIHLLSKKSIDPVGFLETRPNDQRGESSQFGTDLEKQLGILAGRRYFDPCGARLDLCIRRPRRPIAGTP